MHRKRDAKAAVLIKMDKLFCILNLGIYGEKKQTQNQFCFALFCFGGGGGSFVCLMVWGFVCFLSFLSFV